VSIKDFFPYFIFLLAGCVGIPDGLKPVDNFQLERYLGLWYEIARLDHPFERGLSHVTAYYSMNPDGSVRVINRGYSDKDKKLKNFLVFKASLLGFNTKNIIWVRHE